MRLLDLSDERLPANEYVPSATLTIASGDSETAVLSGFNGEAFGVTRMILAANGQYGIGFGTGENLTVRARIRSTRETWFDGVDATAVASLFKNHALQVPAIIGAGRELEVTVANHDLVSAAEVEVLLQGLTRPQLDVRHQTIQGQLGFVPEKRWMCARRTRVPLQQSRTITFEKPPTEQVFAKLGWKSRTSPTNAPVRLFDRHLTLLGPVDDPTLHHLYDQVEGTPYLFTTGKSEKLKVEITNESFVNVHFSYLADTLPISVLDALEGRPSVAR